MQASIASALCHLAATRPRKLLVEMDGAKKRALQDERSLPSDADRVIE